MHRNGNDWHRCTSHPPAYRPRMRLRNGLALGAMTAAAVGLAIGSGTGPQGGDPLDSYERAALIEAQHAQQGGQGRELGALKGANAPGGPHDTWHVACKGPATQPTCIVEQTMRHRGFADGDETYCQRFEMTVLTDTSGPPRVDVPSLRRHERVSGVC